MTTDRALTKRAAVLWISVGTVFVSYLLVYLVLSKLGAYEPAATGISGNGVKWYAWAPYGFVARERPLSFKWRPFPYYVFFPLYWLDCAHWHTEDKSYKNLYPVHDLAYVQP